jgi:ApbE superfamily uncharacterized protein (UPF0280 family)
MIYRSLVGGRFSHLELKYKHTNALIGFGHLESGSGELFSKLQSHLTTLYNELEAYVSQHPAFKTTLKPWSEGANNTFIDKMIKYTSEAGVGPMASVAGGFADELLDIIHEHTDVAFVENGGDVALQSREESTVMIHPGWRSFNSKVSLRIPPGRWGIASSSGLLGPSLSLGKAQMVSVVAENSVRADSFATAIANQVVPGCDPSEIVSGYSTLEAVAIIWNEKMWYRGDFALSLV